MEPGQKEALDMPHGRHAVSEAIGALVLVGVVVIAVAVVWLLLFSSPMPVKVPVLDTIISNRSRTIYLLHKGGDPLRAGEYQVLVDGGDQTGNFTFLGSGTEPWSVGETLVGTAPSMPKRIVIVFNQSGGAATVIGIQDLTGARTVPPPSDVVWYQYPASGKCLWQARKIITIDGSKVTGSLSSFPLLVSLTDADLAAAAQAGGNDILFTASDGTTKLDHEIENFTAATGSLTAWVRIPTLSSGSNTVIYLYYGNSTVGSQGNPTAVWDADYKAVWHLDHDLVDSTVNPNDGTNSGAINMTAKIAKALDFDNVNDYIAVGSDASIDDIFAAGGTFSAWIYPNTIGENNEGRVGDKASGSTGQNGWSFATYTGPELMFRKGFATTRGYWNTPAGSITLNAWNHVVVTYSSALLTNDPTIYVNGISQGITESSTPAGAVSADAGNNMRLGQYAAAQSRTFDGIIDEARVSKSIRTPGWIATEYANQNNPSTFYSVGTAEEGYWKC